jgi:hypothetical protein
MTLPVFLGCLVASIFLNLGYIKFMSTYPELLAKIAVVWMNMMMIGGIGTCIYFSTQQP